MRTHLCRFALFALFPALIASAGEPPAKDYTEFSRLVQKLIADRMPKELEDRGGWGGTVPIPDKLRLPGISRVKVQVGNHEELPNGLWRRYRVWMDDPQKDLKVKVVEFKSTGPKTYRLVLETDAAVHTEMQIQEWVKGLQLVDGGAVADMVVHNKITCDIEATAEVSLSPKLTVAPKIVDMTAELRDFNLKRAGAIVEVEGETARQLGNELKDGIQALIKFREPQFKDNANDAIARALKEGKGTISATSVLQALSAKSP